MNDQEHTQQLAQISALLKQTAGEHDKYEQASLGGQYDVEWPKWYAQYLLDNGLPALLGNEGQPATLTADQLRELLVKADASHRATDPSQNWPDYYAQYLLEALQTQ